MSTSEFVKNIIGDTPKTTSSNEAWRFSVARVLNCGLLKNQFYRNKKESSKEALELFTFAAQKDPTFLLKGAAMAREGHMKGMVLLAIAALAGKASDKFLTDNRNYIVSILRSFGPNQLIQFKELMQSKELGRGFGARPQKWLRDVMESWDPTRVEGYTIQFPQSFRKLLVAVHPRFTDVRGPVSAYVLDSSKESPSYGHNSPSGLRQKALETLKKGSPSPSTIAKTMLDHNLPFDAIKGFYGEYMNGPVGLATITQMGLAGLLLNLKSLDAGVLQTQHGLTALKLRLQEVQKNRAIPLDFAKAYVQNPNPKIREILKQSMADTIGSGISAIADLRIGVSVDISGSMNGEPLMTAGLLAAPFAQTRHLWFTTFDTSLYEEGTKGGKGGNYYYSSNVNSPVCPQITGKSPKEQIDGLLNLRTNGGTDVAVSLREAIKTRRKLDLMVLITDEQHNSRSSLMTVWNQYKVIVNPEAQLWIINASNYDYHAGDNKDPSVTIYQTMNTTMFKNLEYLNQDLESLIKGFDLNALKPVSPYVAS